MRFVIAKRRRKRNKNVETKSNYVLYVFEILYGYAWYDIKVIMSNADDSFVRGVKYNDLNLRRIECV